MLATAAACPDVLVIGVDAAAASMAEASRRAAQGARRGGLANALFVAAAAESLPPELDGIATTVTIHFPWGSLLRGLVCADPAILAGMRRVCRADATVTLLLSVTERDHIADVPTLDRAHVRQLGRRYAAHGFAPVEAQMATAVVAAAAHSTWAKRLGIGTRRTAWLLRFRVCAPYGTTR